MFTRSILIPSLVVCAIAAPIMFSQSQPGKGNSDQQADVTFQAGYNSQNNVWGNDISTSGPVTNPSRQSNSANFQTARMGDPVFYQANSNGNPAQTLSTTNQPSELMPSFPSQAMDRQGMTMQATPNSTTIDNFPTGTTFRGIPFAEMTPDFGSAQTLIYPGNAAGPDLTAQPMEFMPITNFEEIFRFNVTPEWITSRWPRVSTSPGADGLHGLRVALVTGTNSWDLHGSLTYYFDNNQNPQRITFRGWAGNGKKLTDLLTQRFEFKSQPTHWAGFYLAKQRRNVTGGILMQHPAVIYRDNPVQQIAVVMEINNPAGNFVLSDDFHSLIVGSQSTR